MAKTAKNGRIRFRRKSFFLFWKRCSSYGLSRKNPANVRLRKSAFLSSLHWAGSGGHGHLGAGPLQGLCADAYRDHGHAGLRNGAGALMAECSASSPEAPGQGGSMHFFSAEKHCWGATESWSPDTHRHGRSPGPGSKAWTGQRLLLRRRASIREPCTKASIWRKYGTFPSCT